MNKYEAGRVLTVRELTVGDVLHCGRTGGACMPWSVIQKEEAAAYFKVGGSILKMTGKEIRSGLPMFRVIDCPYCELVEEKKQPRPTEPEVDEYFVHTLEASDIASALSKVDNKRNGSGGFGGARLRTKADELKTRAEELAERIVNGGKSISG